MRRRTWLLSAAGGAGALLVGWSILPARSRLGSPDLMLLEPGARPQSGWIEEILEYAALAKAPARFSPSRRFRRPFLKRWRRKGELELGLVLPKRQASTLVQPGMDLKGLARAAPAGRLRSELIPAWVLRESC